ncbi:hypothetical protein CHS0354_030449 [Potamilus streckersoni]|uniref:SAP30-binding protein n=1 Tax=Potamilus streckersoni TaxID=2493646 RepID=A0AAE0W6J8_9BIVA|nr:hypothetical protein CHS0354_030449 [Potamilus streckersoni]
MDGFDTSAMASLASYADESDSDEERPGDLAVDNISDEDTDSKPPSRSSSRPIIDETLLQTSDSTTVVQRKPTKKTTRLVSYGPDEHEEDDDQQDTESESDENGEHGILVEGIQVSSSLNAEQASSLSRSVQNKSFDEIELPLEPTGKCSKHLQEKIARLYEKMREGVNLSASIQNRKDFRNPSIYEKLIEYCGIDEKGTNYPPEIFDPHCWGKESFYDALEKAQKADMEKREKEKKERTKVEFVTGTKKAFDGAPEEKRRKTKWDAQPGTLQQVTMAKAISQNLVMAAATGTKTTVIPAVGNITKKPVK